MPSKDPEKRREYNRRWYANHRDKQRKYLREYMRRWKAENPALATRLRRERNWRSKYGIGQAEYDAMLAAQGGKCALFEVCGSTEPGRGHRYWIVDHDHETGKLRGLLCHKCNVYRVGSNDLQSARAVISYLKDMRPTPLLGSEWLEAVGP
jgi:Recombination endonuclease VII